MRLLEERGLPRPRAAHEVEREDSAALSQPRLRSATRSFFAEQLLLELDGAGERRLVMVVLVRVGAPVVVLVSMRVVMIGRVIMRVGRVMRVAVVVGGPVVMCVVVIVLAVIGVPRAAVQRTGRRRRFRPYRPGAAAGRAHHVTSTLRNPELLPTEDLEREIPARAGGDQLLHVQLLLAAGAAAAAEHVDDVQPSSLEARAPGALVEAEAHRVGDHPGELANLERHHQDPPIGHGIADRLHDALADGQLVHGGVLRATEPAKQPGSAGSERRETVVIVLGPPAACAPEHEHLAPAARPERRNPVRSRVAPFRAGAGEVVRSKLLRDLVRVHAVHPGRVQPEDLPLRLGGERRVAVTFPELGVISNARKASI